MKQAGEWLQRLTVGLKKYKYVALVLLLGVALLLIPTKSSGEAAKPETGKSMGDDDYRQELEQRLSDLLSQMTGAGEVRVMLTLRTGTHTVYQTDTTITSDTSDESSRSSEERKTVILSEGSAYDVAAATVMEYPQFQGAVVVCQGADEASVKLGLVNAVAALTGLRSDQITVLKMK